MSASASTALYDLRRKCPLDKNKKHNIEIVVDRLVIRPDIPRRLTDSCETAAASRAAWSCSSTCQRTGISLFSQNYACEDCGISIEELTPRMFSFNNPTARARRARASARRCASTPSSSSRTRRSILDGGCRPRAGTTCAATASRACTLKRWRKSYHFPDATLIRELCPKR